MRFQWFRARHLCSVNIAKHSYSVTDVRLGFVTWQNMYSTTSRAWSQPIEKWLVKLGGLLLVLLVLLLVVFWEASTSNDSMESNSRRKRSRKASRNGYLSCMWIEPMTARRLCQSCHLWERSWIQFNAPWLLKSESQKFCILLSY